MQTLSKVLLPHHVSHVSKTSNGPQTRRALIGPGTAVCIVTWRMQEAGVEPLCAWGLPQLDRRSSVCLGLVRDALVVPKLDCSTTTSTCRTKKHASVVTLLHHGALLRVSSTPAAQLPGPRLQACLNVVFWLNQTISAPC